MSPISQGEAFARTGFLTTAAMDTSQGHPGQLVMSTFNWQGITFEERYGMSLALKEFIPSQYAGPHPGAPRPGRPANSLAPGLVVPVFTARRVEVTADRWLTSDLNMITGATEWVIDEALRLGLVKAEEPPIDPPPVKLPPTLPVTGLRPLSPAGVRVEELRCLSGRLPALEFSSILMILGSALDPEGHWPAVKPFAVEALRFYRLLRKRLGDPREIPAEDR